MLRLSANDFCADFTVICQITLYVRFNKIAVACIVSLDLVCTRFPYRDFSGFRGGKCRRKSVHPSFGRLRDKVQLTPAGARDRHGGQQFAGVIMLRRT